MIKALFIKHIFQTSRLYKRCQILQSPIVCTRNLLTRHQGKVFTHGLYFKKPVKQTSRTWGKVSSRHQGLRKVYFRKLLSRDQGLQERCEILCSHSLGTSRKLLSRDQGLQERCEMLCSHSLGTSRKLLSRDQGLQERCEILCSHSLGTSRDLTPGESSQIGYWLSHLLWCPHHVWTRICIKRGLCSSIPHYCLNQWQCHSSEIDPELLLASPVLMVDVTRQPIPRNANPSVHSWVILLPAACSMMPQPLPEQQSSTSLISAMSRPEHQMSNSWRQLLLSTDSQNIWSVLSFQSFLKPVPRVSTNVPSGGCPETSRDSPPSVWRM